MVQRLPSETTRETELAIYEERPKPVRVSLGTLLQGIKEVLLAMFVAVFAVAYATFVWVFFVPGGLDAWVSPTNRREDTPAQEVSGRELPTVGPRVKPAANPKSAPKDFPIRRLR